MIKSSRHRLMLMMVRWWTRKYIYNVVFTVAAAELKASSHTHQVWSVWGSPGYTSVAVKLQKKCFVKGCVDNDWLFNVWVNFSFNAPAFKDTTKTLKQSQFHTDSSLWPRGSNKAVREMISLLHARHWVRLVETVFMAERWGWIEERCFSGVWSYDTFTIIVLPQQEPPESTKKIKFLVVTLMQIKILLTRNSGW